MLHSPMLQSISPYILLILIITAGMKYKMSAAEGHSIKRAITHWPDS